MAARFGRLAQLAGIFNAIGAAEDRCDGQPLQRARLCIAAQGGGIDHLAHTISTTIRGEECVDRRRGWMPLNTAIRQIKRRISQRQKRDVLRAVFGHHKGGLCRPRPTRQTSGKRRKPFGVCRGCPQNRVGTRDET